MKKLFVFLTFLSASLMAVAQTAKPKTAAKPAAKPVSQQPVLKNLNDSASYAMASQVFINNRA